MDISNNTFETNGAGFSAGTEKAEGREKKGIEGLSLENSEEVVGGYIYKCNNHPDFPWEVISDVTGNVLGRFASHGEAVVAANKYNAEMVAQYGEEGAKPYKISTDRIWKYSTLEKIRAEHRCGERESINKILPEC